MQPGELRLSLRPRLRDALAQLEEQLAVCLESVVELVEAVEAACQLIALRLGLRDRLQEGGVVRQELLVLVTQGHELRAHLLDGGPIGRGDDVSGFGVPGVVRGEHSRRRDGHREGGREDRGPAAGWAWWGEGRAHRLRSPLRLRGSGLGIPGSWMGGSSGEPPPDVARDYTASRRIAALHPAHGRPRTIGSAAPRGQLRKPGRRRSARNPKPATMSVASKAPASSSPRSSALT